MEPRVALEIVGGRWPGRLIASTAELKAVGLDDRVLTACVRAGVLLRVRRGAYAVSSSWAQLSPWDQDDYRIDAHAAGSQGNPVYSHASAARLHGFATWNVGSQVHVLTSADSGASHGADAVGHRAALGEDETVRVRTRGGREVLATSPVRTVLDCARAYRPEEAAVIGDSALHSGLALGDLTASLQSSPIIRGSVRAARLLGLLDGRAESAGETRTRFLLSRLGVEPPEVQHCIGTPFGIFRADYAWPRIKVILEFDGRGKYYDYRPTAEALLLERRRETALMDLGWRVIRLTSADLERPDLVAERLAAVFEAAA